jgi:CheY-like chemotaxis protein
MPHWLKSRNFRRGQPVQILFFATKGGGTIMLVRILVVDDSLLIRQLLDNILAAEGYEVLLASNGKEAIEVAKEKSPRIIVMDINMPVINGLQACTRLKAIKETRSIPVVLMTGLKMYKMDAIEAGADGFLTKPFDISDILNNVNSLIRPQ